MATSRAELNKRCIRVRLQHATARLLVSRNGAGGLHPAERRHIVNSKCAAFVVVVHIAANKQTRVPSHDGWQMQDISDAADSNTHHHQAVGCSLQRWCNARTRLIKLAFSAQAAAGAASIHTALGAGESCVRRRPPLTLRLLLYSRAARRGATCRANIAPRLKRIDSPVSDTRSVTRL